jgi:predicted nucleotidyltransferase component of viral defense system
MVDANYRAQVELLLKILPEVAKEECFALHGGTAINLFIENLPRLSVDIDLTFIPKLNREDSLHSISAALARVKTHMQKILPSAHIEHKREVAKIIVRSSDGAVVKVEVNTVNRGIYGQVENRDLCQAAQNEFNAFCHISYSANRSIICRKDLRGIG